MKSGENLVDLFGLEWFDGLFLAISLHFQAKLEADRPHVRHWERRCQLDLHSFHYSTAFGGHYLDIVYDSAHYRAIKANTSHEDELVNVDSFETQLFEEEGRKSFVPELERLFEAIEGLQ